MKKLIETFCLFLVVLFSNLTFAQNGKPSSIDDLPDEKKKAFEEQAKYTILKLERFIMQMIEYKNGPLGVNAEELATQLFNSKDNYIHVIPNVYRNDAVKRFRVKEYFNRLKALPYERVSIQFYYIYFSENLTKGPDNKYHGTVNFIQRFKGEFKDNELPAYIDTMEKTLKVIIEKEIIERGSVVTENWTLRIGDIDVVEKITYKFKE